MVFKIDFPITEDPGFPYLMKDLALLAQTGFKVVIVPGAKEYIDTILAGQKISAQWSKADGPPICTDHQCPGITLRGNGSFSCSNKIHDLSFRQPC